MCFVALTPPFHLGCGFAALDFRFAPLATNAGAAAVQFRSLDRQLWT
jgi:hypothetical protein